MDAWMDLHAMPAAQTDTVDGNTISAVALEPRQPRWTVCPWTVR